MSQENVDFAIHNLSNEIEARSATEASTAAPDEVHNENITDEPSGDSIWSCIDSEIASSTSRGTNLTREPNVQLQQYLNAGCIERKTDPLNWWSQEGKQSYPQLYKTAVKYLIIPATSVPSERVFSTAGAVITKRRNRLGTKNAAMLITLHNNLN